MKTVEVGSASPVKLDFVDGLDPNPGEYCMEPTKLLHETGAASNRGDTSPRVPTC